MKALQIIILTALFVVGWASSVSGVTFFQEPNRFRHAKVLSVHDGDTIEIEMALGGGLAFTTSCRLFGIDARELSNKPGGQIDRDYLRDMITKHAPTGEVVVELVGARKSLQDKYGRLLIKLWLFDKEGADEEYRGEPFIANELMLKSGHAKFMNDKGQKEEAADPSEVSR